LLLSSVVLVFVCQPLVAAPAKSAAAAVKADNQSQRPFVSFEEFIKSTAAAKFADYKDREGVAVKSEKDFEEMKAHILDLYKGVTPTHSFMTAEGQYIDCIPFAQQPGLRNAPPKDKVMPNPPPAPASPPAPANPPGVDGRPTMPAGPAGLGGGKDAFGNEMSCPEGSIPMLRVTLETMTRFPTRDAFFGRGLKRAPPLPGRP
jgi:hypothetical protein